MKIIGCIILFLGLGLVCYLMFFTKYGWKKITAVFVVFGIFGGFAILSDRIRSVNYKNKVGELSIEADVQKARTDAEEITRIRNEVETQKNEINMVIRDANSAREKLGTVDETVQIATKKLKELNNINDFSFMLLKAHNDDRNALHSLEEFSQISGPLQELANNAIYEIISQPSKRSSIRLDWKTLKVSPEESSLHDFIISFRNAGIAKNQILTTIWQQERFSKYDRLEFIYTVIKNDSSIRTATLACEYMNTEAKINKTILAYKDYLAWWEKNRHLYLEKDTKPKLN